MADTDQFSDQKILALTAVGESDDKGDKGMQQTVNTVMNRVAANLKWMGGNDARAVCLQPGQYDCWNQGSADRKRIIDIALTNASYGPYIDALALAASALAGDLPDVTNGAVSYGDDGEQPEVHPGSVPCLVDGDRTFFGLEAVK